MDRNKEIVLTMMNDISSGISSHIELCSQHGPSSEVLLGAAGHLVAAELYIKMAIRLLRTAKPWADIQRAITQLGKHAEAIDHLEADNTGERIQDDVRIRLEPEFFSYIVELRAVIRALDRYIGDAMENK